MISEQQIIIFYFAGNTTATQLCTIFLMFCLKKSIFATENTLLVVT